MRVIAGRFRSRKLKSVPGLAVRPTPDRLKESFFSILAQRVEGVVFVDAYAGSGSVGIEALSRGAKRVIFIEQSSEALVVLRENVNTLGIGNEAVVLRGRAVPLLKEQKAQIVFLDPPYDHVKEYTGALAALAETTCELVAAQHRSRLTLEEQYGELRKTRVLRQGDNSITFFEREKRDELASEQEVDVHDVGAGGASAEEITEGIEKMVGVIGGEMSSGAQTQFSRPGCGGAGGESARRVGGPVGAIGTGAQNSDVIEPGESDGGGKSEFLVTSSLPFSAHGHCAFAAG